LAWVQGFRACCTVTYCASLKYALPRAFNPSTARRSTHARAPQVVLGFRPSDLLRSHAPVVVLASSLSCNAPLGRALSKAKLEDAMQRMCDAPVREALTLVANLVVENLGDSIRNGGEPATALRAGRLWESAPTARLCGPADSGARAPLCGLLRWRRRSARRLAALAAARRACPTRGRLGADSLRVGRGDRTRVGLTVVQRPPVNHHRRPLAQQSRRLDPSRLGFGIRAGLRDALAVVWRCLGRWCTSM
jgi:hypothetical protein